MAFARAARSGRAARRARCRSRPACWRAIAAAGTRSGSRNSSRRKTVAPAACPPVWSTKRRCGATCICEFCYVGTLLNIEGEWREELPLEVLRRAFPEAEGLQVSLTGGEIFMRKDILGVMEVFREKGYVCGYLTTNGTIITDERAEALAELAAPGIPEAHQRLHRRAERAARQGAWREGHVRADVRGSATSAGGGEAQARAVAGQRQHDRRARDARCAARDGRRRGRTRRRRHRAQPPDVQHAGRGRRDRPPARHGRRQRDLDVRHRGSRSRPGTGPRPGRRPGGAMPRARHPLRHAAEGQSRRSSSRTTRPARRCEDAACIRS